MKTRAWMALLALGLACWPMASRADDAVFEIVCKNLANEASVRHFAIRLIPGARALVTDRDAEFATPIEANTYDNAFVWYDGPDTYLFNRFNGLLSLNKDTVRFQCVKTGGAKP